MAPRFHQSVRRTTILRYLEAFVHHTSARRSFHGVLRTNAIIKTNAKSQIGRWINGQPITTKGDKRTFLAELNALVKADDNRLKEALTAVRPQVERFITSVEWAPRGGQLSEVEEEVDTLISGGAMERRGEREA